MAHFRDSLAGPFSSGIVLVSLYVEVSDLKENALVSLARPNFLYYIEFLAIIFQVFVIFDDFS